MLNPPLALLSDDLLISLVEHVAKLPDEEESLRNLSLADRAFTLSCQKYIFRHLKFNSKKKMFDKLKEAKKILNDNPFFVNQIRSVELIISQRTLWVLHDPAFIAVMQLLSKSPVPPHELRFAGHFYSSFRIRDPIRVMERFAHSFFAQSLTVLRLAECVNVPLPFLLIFPALKEVCLERVGPAEESYNGYPDDLFSGQTALRLEVLEFRDSRSFVEQMVTPPPRFNTPVIVWSNLRVLMLDPYERGIVAGLQPFLDRANLLEELYLIDRDRVWQSQYHLPVDQLPLARFVNLSKLSNLRVFSLCAVINYHRARQFTAVLQDINIVLHTIPECNKMSNLWFDFTIVDPRPFRTCLEQNWDGMFDEIIRIANGKPLELELQMHASAADFHSFEYPELYSQIREKAEVVFGECSNLCTHFWDATCLARGIDPFPCGRVRSRCGR